MRSELFETGTAVTAFDSLHLLPVSARLTSALLFSSPPHGADAIFRALRHFPRDCGAHARCCLLVCRARASETHLRGDANTHFAPLALFLGGGKQ